MKKFQGIKSDGGVVPSILIGEGVAVVSTLLLMVVISICIQNEYMNITRISVFAAIVQLLGAFLGASVAGKLVKEKKVMACLGSSGGYYLMLMLSSLIIFGKLGIGVVSGLLACAAGCGGGILLSMNGKKRRTSRKWKGLHR